MCKSIDGLVGGAAVVSSNEYYFELGWLAVIDGRETAREFEAFDVGVQLGAKAS